MAAHLTISLELITFMKWVLEHKQEAFARFIHTTLDPKLREDLLCMTDGNGDVSSEELYETVNNFLGFIEESMAHSLSDAKPATTSDGRKELYHSLCPRTQAQLNQAFDEDLLSASMQQAVTLLREAPQPTTHSEQVKKHVLLQSLLSKWHPSDGDVN